MTELIIPHWTGICTIKEKLILGLGNDIYQIGLALIEAVENGYSKISFNDADKNRKKDYNIDGICHIFETLKNGIVLKKDIIKKKCQYNKCTL